MKTNDNGKDGKKIFDMTFENIFLFCALISVISVVSIMIFIFINGTPAIFEIGVSKFIFGLKWRPSKELFGILPMIVASILTTLGAIIIGIPVGIMTAVFMTDYATKPVLKIINPAIDLLAGLPSVVYGFFGLIIVVPLVDYIFGGIGAGNSLLSAVIILSIMILPTIINTTKTAINAVPNEYREGSLALGATKEQTIFKVVLLAAKSGIFSGAVLSIGRAIGETMAIILVSGNAAIIPDFGKGFIYAITSPVRTLTANIATEMSYASGLHQSALFATGVVLFIFILSLNLLLSFVVNKGENK